MSMHGRSQRSVAAWMGIVFAVLSIVWVAEAWGQASYTAQIRGVVKDQSGALVPNATITITNDATGISDNYPTGTNFVSNGQRNATAQITLDGSPISAPEQGEGGNSNVYYQPSVEIVQEFKVQNNSFSAEFGNNGGTIVNMVLKQGSNNIHGSGWWYGQRANFDARDFFNSGEKPDHVRDQYGFSLGGPLKKNKT